MGMRGVAPVLSTISMVVVAVVVGILVYSWVVPFYLSQEQGLGNAIPSGSVKIGHVWCGDGNLFILLSSDAEMEGNAWIFVEDSLKDVVASCQRTVSLVPHEEVLVTCPLCDPGAPPSSYYVRVVIGSVSAREGPYQLNITSP